MKQINPRLYRVYVGARHDATPEYAAFVEASSHEEACEKVAGHVASLEVPFSTVRSVRERLYNCFSAKELLDQNVSEDLELRLFESGWSNGKPTYYMPEPLFFVERPAALIRKWAAIPDATGDSPA